MVMSTVYPKVYVRVWSRWILTCAADFGSKKAVHSVVGEVEVGSVGGRRGEDHHLEGGVDRVDPFRLDLVVDLILRQTVHLLEDKGLLVDV